MPLGAFHGRIHYRIKHIRQVDLPVGKRFKRFANIISKHRHCVICSADNLIGDQFD